MGNARSSTSTELPLAECRLDLTGLRAQRDRYRALSRDVTTVNREPGQLEVQFGPELDHRLLDETIALERECCPFFRLDFDHDARRLIASVEQADQDPALDAIAAALSPA